VIVLAGYVQRYGIVRIYGENNIPSVVIDTTNFTVKSIFPKKSGSGLI